MHELVMEAHDRMRLHGYITFKGYEALYDPHREDLFSDDLKDLVGCLVRYEDEHGNEASEAVYYPKGWNT